MTLIKKTFVACIALASASIILAANAAETATPIDRYLSVANVPLASQADLLAQTFQVRFPAAVKTIGDAMRYLLQFSGYSLVADNQLIPAAKNLMALPLPQADRNFGPLSLQQGLLTLAGEPFGLLVDPVHRLIALRILPQYAPLYPTSTRPLFSGAFK